MERLITETYQRKWYQFSKAVIKKTLYNILIGQAIIKIVPSWYISVTDIIQNITDAIRAQCSAEWN